MLAAVGALLFCVSMKVSVGADPLESDERRPENKGVDLRSHGRQTADEVRRRRATEDVVLRQGPAVPSRAGSAILTAPRERREEEEEGRDVQVNDPALDHVQSFPGTRPFELSIQSETSIAAFRSNVVIGYNSSADQPLVVRSESQP